MTIFLICLTVSLILGDFQSGPGRPSEDVNARIDQLSRQLVTLEHTMAGDIRMILNLLQHQHNSSSISNCSNNNNNNNNLSNINNNNQLSKESSSPNDTVASSHSSGTNSGALVQVQRVPLVTSRAPALTQRSASEPQPPVIRHQLHHQLSSQNPVSSAGAIVPASHLSQHLSQHLHAHGPLQPSTSHELFR